MRALLPIRSRRKPFLGLASNSNKSRNYLVHIPITATAKLIGACRNKLTKAAFCAMLFWLITGCFSAHRLTAERRLAMPLRNSAAGIYPTSQRALAGPFFISGDLS